MAAVLLTALIPTLDASATSTHVPSYKQPLQKIGQISVPDTQGLPVGCPRVNDPAFINQVLNSVKVRPYALASNTTFSVNSLEFEYNSTICLPILEFANQTSYMTVYLNKDLSVDRVIAYPKPGVYFTGSTYLWSGVEVTPSSYNSNPYVTQTQATFPVPQNKTPSQNKNANCCMIGEWVGLMTTSLGGSNFIVQGGVVVGATSTLESESGSCPSGKCWSPFFFHQEGGPTQHLFSNHHVFR